jgi:hypothetical protein
MTVIPEFNLNQDMRALLKVQSLGVDVDPTTVQLRIRKPDGTLVVGTYGTPGPLTVQRTDAGDYFADYVADQAGRWERAWVTEGTYRGSTKRIFTVRDTTV